MKVIVKQAGSAPEVREIENTLEAFQRIVGGYIEVVRFKDCLIVCNEEGKLQGLPVNFRLGYDVIVGDVVFTQSDNTGDFTDLSESDIDSVIKSFE